MKNFLASVGNGLLLARKDGNLVPVAHVNTLTDSTVSVTSTSEDIRAGQMAKLYGRFTHSAGMTVQLTDAMFDMNYIAMQVGSELQRGGLVMHTETVKAVATNKITLSKPVQAIGESCGLDKYLVWYREAGCNADDTYQAIEVEADATEVTNTAFVDGNEYCVSYFTQDLSARTLLVSASFVPSELVLVLTTKLFAADANSPEGGKPSGEITLKFPRFKLDGSFDLSLAMASAATVSLNGTALAVSDGTCEDEGVYAEIVEVVNGRKWYDGLESLAFEGFEGNTATAAEITEDTQLTVFAIFNDTTLPLAVPGSDLTWDVTGTVKVDANGKVTTAAAADDTITVKVAGEGLPSSVSSIEATLTITA